MPQHTKAKKQLRKTAGNLSKGAERIAKEAEFAKSVKAKEKAGKRTLQTDIQALRKRGRPLDKAIDAAKDAIPRTPRPRNIITKPKKKGGKKK